mgnify:CR=1 FL=1
MTEEQIKHQIEYLRSQKENPTGFYRQYLVNLYHLFYNGAKKNGTDWCPNVGIYTMVKAAYEYVGPVYMRFGRLAVPVINDRPDYKFEMGKGIVLREGKDVTIVANGLCVAASLEAAEKLAAEGISAEVINIHTIKPLDEDMIVAAAKETGKVVTVEEHSVIGGLGGAVCECLSEKAPVPVKRIGVNDVFGESGPATALLEKYGLDAEGIYKQVKEFV